MAEFPILLIDPPIRRALGANIRTANNKTNRRRSVSANNKRRV